MAEKKTTGKAARAAKPAARKAGGEADVLAMIAAMQASDRSLGERLHAIITATAPALEGRQDRLLLPERAEIQIEVRDTRLHARSEPRRRRYVADRLRSEAVGRP
jgi:hypothetical protein